MLEGMTHKKVVNSNLQHLRHIINNTSYLASRIQYQPCGAFIFVTLYKKATS